MNYLKVYCNLIRKAEKRTPPKGYTEKHHTFPKSIFGKNNRIVVLTAREHYIAHALLEKICIKRYGMNSENFKKMNFAHISMKNWEKRYYNSYLYENAKIRRSENIKGKNSPNYGKVWTNEMKKHLSRIRKENYSGENHPCYGKPKSQKVRENISNSRKGKMMGEKNHISKWWKITFSNGSDITMCGFYTWAKENGYHPSAVHGVYSGKINYYKDIVAVEKLA